MSLTTESLAKITGAIIGHMITEAAYRGETVTVAALHDAIVNDPKGETACFFRRSALDAVALAERMQADPELLGCFGA